MSLLESVIRINQEQPREDRGAARPSTGQSLEGVRVAVLGLSFKPETSDVRESPAFPIMRELLAQGAVLTAYDPVARHEAEKAFPDPEVTYCDTPRRRDRRRRRRHRRHALERVP